MAKKLRTDWLLFAVAAGLALFGSVMVYSASAMISLNETANNPEGPTQFVYFYKQFGFTLVGLVAMLIVSKVNYQIYERREVVFALIILTVLLLLAVYGFPKINGARRWIRIPGASFQPSEIAKIVLPIFLAYFLTKNEKLVTNLKETVFPCLALLSIFCGLIVFEPDLGTTIVLCAIFGAVYFAAGANLLHLAVAATTFVVLVLGAVLFATFRVKRLMAFFDPCSAENAVGAGYQVCQSLMGIGSGGITGEGFAQGQQKLFYLPYPYSDFIFATVGEELGLIGTLGVVVAFGFLLWRGARAALNAPDRFGKLLGIGIITGIIVQALFNISVVLSLLPAKGIPLPFISYGGSSVIITLTAIGVLLNISQHSGFVSVTKLAVKPRRRRRK